MKASIAIALAALLSLSEPVTVYTHATLIDGTGAPARSNMTVIVSGRKIKAVFQDGSRPVPPAATTVDLTGRFLMPGLIDSHVHLGTQARDSGVMQAILASVFMHGVTTVRDMGGSMKIVTPLAYAGQSDTVRSPRVFYSAIFAGPGRWFEGEFGVNAASGFRSGESPLVRRVDARIDVRAVVADAKAAGATGIKIYNSVDQQVVRALVTEAHRQHMRAWSHLSVDPGRPSDLIADGVDVVSHADQFRAELLRTTAPATDSVSRAVRLRELRAMSPDSPRFSSLIASMKRKHTILDPTLSIMLPRQTPADTSRANMLNVYGTFHFSAAMTRRAAQAGIPIVAGTDAIGGSSANLHAELQMLVDSAGLTPLQAIRAATMNGAMALSAQDSLGSIGPGKIADMIILCADPSSNIRNTQAIAAVVKGGRIFKRSAAPSVGPLAKGPGAPSNCAI